MDYHVNLFVDFINTLSDYIINVTKLISLIAIMKTKFLNKKQRASTRLQNYKTE